MPLDYRQCQAHDEGQGVMKWVTLVILDPLAQFEADLAREMAKVALDPQGLRRG